MRSANTKSSEMKSNPSVKENVCCTVCLHSVDVCECQAKSKPKSRKVVSKTNFKIHTVSKGKFMLEREEGSLLQEKVVKPCTCSENSSKLSFSNLVKNFESKNKKE